VKKILPFILLMLLPLLTMCSGPYGHMGGWDRAGNYGCGFGHGYGGMFMGILFLIALGVAIYFIIQTSKKSATGQGQETPVDILKKRYAKGEITKEEFDRMKKELE
jgi:Predicted membrane protein